jgi:acyl-coenzyme A thioesterase PaaI-like protein
MAPFETQTTPGGKFFSGGLGARHRREGRDLGKIAGFVVTSVAASENGRTPGYRFFGFKKFCLASGAGSGPIARMRELPHTRSCFVCGESNPAGLNLRFETDGTLVRARFAPRLEYAGFRETVHGGVIATVLDEAMVWACAVATKKFAFCAELGVRYLHPARPAEPFLVEARLVENRRNRILNAQAELRTETGQVIATATGKYVPVKEPDVAKMAADFVDDPEWVFRQLESPHPPS